MKKWQTGFWAVALTGSFGLLAACESEELPRAGEGQEPYNVQLGELSDNPEDYSGQQITIRGEAETAIGQTAFVLEDEGFFSDEQVVVFNATGAPILLPENEPTQRVQVTGEARQLVVADLEREYGLDLDPELFVEYEDRPALVAQSIAFAPTPEEISEEPQAYFGRRIAVAGEVAGTLASGTFALQEEQLFGGESVLVVGVNPIPTLTDEEEVVVVGVLRPYVSAEFERDYDLTWDLDLQRQIEAEYTQRPVLVAEEVYPSAQ